mgnify:CR=1 FL=1
MTKDVLLSIKGLQIGENEQNDTIEVISPGDYYFRNGKHFFMYEEVMEGQKESTRNMIKVRDNYMELTKKGAVNVHMIFEKNKKKREIQRKKVTIKVGPRTVVILKGKQDEN